MCVVGSYPVKQPLLNRARPLQYRNCFIAHKEVQRTNRHALRKRFCQVGTSYLCAVEVTIKEGVFESIVEAETNDALDQSDAGVKNFLPRSA